MTAQQPTPEGSEDVLATLERLEAAATPGPWEKHVEDAQADLPPDFAIWMPDVGHDGALVESEVDAEFIAAARNALPDLIPRVREAEADMAEATETYTALHTDWERQIERAEKAEAEVAALRATVERLADECARDGLWLVRRLPGNGQYGRRAEDVVRGLLGRGDR